jgi:hypothetical protein
LSVYEFAAYYARREQPVVVRGALADWPPLKNWTLDYLRSHYGWRPVRVGLAKEGLSAAQYAQSLKALGLPLARTIESMARIGLIETRMTFARAIDVIFHRSDPDLKCRIHQESLDSFWNGALAEECPAPSYVPRKLLTANIWMGSAGNVTGTHYDTEPNINVQLLGRKEVILYPSWQFYELYPRSAFDFMANFSQVNVAAPDLKRHPQFQGATPLRAVLEPGDFLFIPVYWWHYFNTLEASLNVNFWWTRTVRQALKWQGLRYWPRMAKDGYLHRHILQLPLQVRH